MVIGVGDQLSAVMEGECVVPRDRKGRSRRRWVRRGIKRCEVFTMNGRERKITITLGRDAIAL